MEATKSISTPGAFEIVFKMSHVAWNVMCGFSDDELVLILQILQMWGVISYAGIIDKQLQSYSDLRWLLKEEEEEF